MPCYTSIAQLATSQGRALARCQGTYPTFCQPGSHGDALRYLASSPLPWRSVLGAVRGRQPRPTCDRWRAESPVKSRAAPGVASAIDTHRTDARRPAARREPVHLLPSLRAEGDGGVPEDRSGPPIATPPRRRRGTRRGDPGAVAHRRRDPEPTPGIAEPLDASTSRSPQRPTGRCRRRGAHGSRGRPRCRAIVAVDHVRVEPADRGHSNVGTQDTFSRW